MLGCHDACNAARGAPWLHHPPRVLTPATLVLFCHRRRPPPRRPAAWCPGWRPAWRPCAMCGCGAHTRWRPGPPAWRSCSAGRTGCRCAAAHSLQQAGCISWLAMLAGRQEANGHGTAGQRGARLRRLLHLAPHVPPRVLACSTQPAPPRPPPACPLPAPQSFSYVCTDVSVSRLLGELQGCAHTSGSLPCAASSQRCRLLPAIWHHTLHLLQLRVSLPVRPPVQADVPAAAGHPVAVSAGAGPGDACLRARQVSLAAWHGLRQLFQEHGGLAKASPHAGAPKSCSAVP